jgi:hypothetical protein
MITVIIVPMAGSMRNRHLLTNDNELQMKSKTNVTTMPQAQLTFLDTHAAKPPPI